MQDQNYPEQIFENILRQTNNDSKKELEIRFHGRFMNLQKSEGKDGAIFKSNIQPNVFHEILSSFRKGDIENVTECEREQYTVSIIHNRPERLISYSNSDVRLMKKTRNVLPRPFSSGGSNGSYVYVNPKGFKIGLATEEMIYDEAKLFAMQQEVEKLTQLSDNSQHKKNIIQRRIDRTTFMQHITDKNGHNPFIVFKFDFSVVYCSTNTNEDDIAEPHFEIELEYIGNKQTEFIDDVNDSIEQIAKQFGRNIETMLRLIQKQHESSSVITWNEHNSVLMAYNTMLNPRQKIHLDRVMFRGAQPETLHSRHLEWIAKNDYFIADKSDGERAHMLCSKDGTVYLISRFLHVTKTAIKCPSLTVSVFDVELFLCHSQPNTILIFDILTQNGKDVRDRSTSDRLSILSSLDLRISDTGNDSDSDRSNGSDSNRSNDRDSNRSNGSDSDRSTHSDSDRSSWRIMLKKMHFSKRNSFPKKEIMKILNDCDSDYQTDGLIFTPANEPHPLNRKWQTLLKWKPQTLNSIDLYIEKGVQQQSHTKGYYLYANSVQILDKQTGNVGILISENVNDSQVQFDTFKAPILLPNNQLEILRTKPTRKVLFFPCPFIAESDVFNSLMPNCCVVEFIFNLETKTLEPIRIRHDKTAIGFQGSNYLKIALDTWETMVSPILKEHLMRYNFSKYRKGGVKGVSGRGGGGGGGSGSGGGLNNSFLYHNIIKENMIRTSSDYVKRAYFREMKSLPSNFDPSRQAWILPNIPEIKNLMTKGKYKYISNYVDEDIGEIVVPINIEPNLSSSIKLLDLCSGKGGDLWKWIRSDINYVFGLDNESILLMDQEDAAIKRWKQIRRSEDADKLSVVFTEMDARAKVSDYLISKQIFYEFDISSCFFAMHYFFGSQRDFNSFFLNVDELLTFGGYYIGMVMNGERLYNLLKKNKGVYQIISEKGQVLCKIQQKYPELDVTIHSRNTFGLEIEVDIADSILDDYLPTQEEKLNKREYLVNLAKLQQLADGAGFDLVEYSSLSDILSRGDHIHDPQKYNIELTQAEKEFSSLFTCFTFQKKTNSLWKRKMLKRFELGEQPSDESLSSHPSPNHIVVPNVNYPDLSGYDENKKIQIPRNEASQNDSKINSTKMQFENIWKQKWKTLEQNQLQSLICDKLVYKPRETPPLFKIIPSKTQNVKRERNNGNSKLPPVFSISVKKQKTTETDNEG